MRRRGARATAAMAPDWRHTRTCVYAPGEAERDAAFYERHAGAAGSRPLNFTAFREAERRFKMRSAPVDLAQVLDLRNPAARFGVYALAPSADADAPRRYAISGVPGFSFIPAAVGEAEQKRWIARSLAAYTAPPNTTNLDAHYRIPAAGLWSFFQSSARPGGAAVLTIDRIPHADDGDAARALPAAVALRREDAKALMRRVRWATLGYPYDWTSKTYDFATDAAPFPADLAAWASLVAGRAGFADFRPEAGIVNVYQPGDTLTGHVDRSEENMDTPLISLSLGASCIFLLGGATRDDPVLPMLLASGDVVIMSGGSRTFYHGVPRILTAAKDGCPTPLAASSHDSDEIRDALELLGDARININIRQVR